MILGHYEFTEYLKSRFPDFKVQKISVDAGFSCPNRDGVKGFGGCVYCDNRTFNPAYCQPEKTISEQIHEGIRFFAHKYPEMKYLAYFQAYSNTYADISILQKKYEEALQVEDVVGIIIATRPDCVSEEILDYLKDLSQKTFVMLEYGLESTLNETLLRINRGHTYEEAVQAISLTEKRNIPIGAHLILGLPGETREQIISHADKLSQLPLTSLKLHQLQIIRHTALAQQYETHPEQFHIYTVEEYIELVTEFLRHLRKDIHIDRFVSQSPQKLLIAPKWGLKNHEFRERLLQYHK